MSLNIKQISNFQLKSLRIAGFIEFIQQAAKLFKTFRESGEEGQSQLPEKVEAVLPYPDNPVINNINDIITTDKPLLLISFSLYG